ncbi:MAG TPA: hypothetical protein VGF82_26515 [Terracidiphilus sp.]
MGVFRYGSLCVLALTFFSGASGSGSPLNNKLLSLVPAGAEIVAGFENYPDPHRHGQLLLTPHNNRLDLADWQAIAGVDPKRNYQEFIEVTSSGAQQETLSEHLLLVAGSFDRERIFNATEANGAERSQFQSEPVMLIKPFAREKGEMTDKRWLVILDNRIGLFGTPSIVQRALSRYAAHTDIDMPLMERLSQMPRDVSSWNVIVSAPRPDERALVSSVSPWGRLLEDSQVLMVGARFGPKVRVDFSLHAAREHGAEFFSQKAAFFAEVFRDEIPHVVKKWRVANVQVEAGCVRGSIEMSKQQFEMWSVQASLPQGPKPPEQRPVSRGE